VINNSNAPDVETKEYLYLLHGLIVKSSFVIPELIPAEQEKVNKIDVTITFGKVPKTIDYPVINNSELKLSEKERYFLVKGLAHFYIANGNTIIIEQIEHIQMARIRVYILGGCIGAILSQRNMIPIHGSSVLINGLGIIFSGSSGSGKSTITTSFINKGCKFLSDDITAICKNDNGQFVIHPSYPLQKICNDAKEIIRYEYSEIKLVDSLRNKYAVFSISNFWNKVITLNGLFHIAAEETSEVYVYEICGNEKITTLLKSIYGINAIQHLGIKPDFFKQLLELSQKIKIYKLVRPLHGFTVKEQTDLVWDILSNRF